MDFLSHHGVGRGAFPWDVRDVSLSRRRLVDDVEVSLVVRAGVVPMTSGPGTSSIFGCLLSQVLAEPRHRCLQKCCP